MDHLQLPVQPSRFAKSSRSFQTFAKSFAGNSLMGKRLPGCLRKTFPDYFVVSVSGRKLAASAFAAFAVSALKFSISISSGFAGIVALKAIFVGTSGQVAVRCCVRGRENSATQIATAATIKVTAAQRK